MKRKKGGRKEAPTYLPLHHLLQLRMQRHTLESRHPRDHMLHKRMVRNLQHLICLLHRWRQIRKTKLTPCTTSSTGSRVRVVTHTADTPHTTCASHSETHPLLLLWLLLRLLLLAGHPTTRRRHLPISSTSRLLLLLLLLLLSRRPQTHLLRPRHLLSLCRIHIHH